MPSLIEGYEYDIFISYRQKDNKGERWVTEFVEALKAEVDATFKDPVSIYFDENEYDGLLETHEVDDSLRNKLRCLVFIPIISQTYCDPKSYAWTNEFIPFKQVASTDRFGLKVRLTNGNVASRILPVRIHNLSTADKAVLENEVGTVRSIDFIYKEPGVNRPLRSQDDEVIKPKQIFYRDQINKVANAVKEIVESLQVTDSGQSAQSMSMPTQSSRHSNTGPAGKATKAVLWTAVALVLVFIGWYLLSKTGLTGSQSQKSVAVLPLDNLTGDPEQDYFVNGFQDALIGALGQVSALRVISRTSTLRYRESKKLMQEIARELGVDHVVEGSVYRSGDHIRIQLQLIEAFPDEQHLWSKEYAQDFQKIPALQSNMVENIAREIHVNLTPREQSLLNRTADINPDAYKAYLKGIYYWEKLTADDLSTALTFFEQARELDPNYALAYSGIAIVWLGRLQQGLVSYVNVGSKMRTPALKALELDSTLSGVHSALAGLAWAEWNYRQAEREYRKAIELNPNSSFAHAYLSNLLSVLHQPEEAMEHINLALTLDPFNPLYKALYGMNLNYAHEYDRAIKELGDALKTSPTDAVALSTLRTTYHMKGMHTEALDIWKRSYDARGDEDAIAALSNGERTGGYNGALEGLAELMIARSDTSFITPFQIGTMFTRAGNAQQAIEWLEKAYYAHDNNMPYIGIDPIFEGLQGNPRYQSLLEKLGLTLE